ncbi:uncharacterized protein EI90DRAFT_3285707 [Cantharellus anzutake]|uniref:uncharacterized protein n=1 Tax=Cantharellus anzutake TaxID=1750568 RepID=UPI001903B301|nr:uncharacterized protein EI90DRAFT_3285707 [Cantharellus anzutake]KAF8341657.1 hypothetical protein EI90DRAFT_3285707 [Cantharellus anzutake]
MTGTSAVQPPLMLPRVSMQAHGARLAGNQSGESTDESAHRLSKNVQTRVSVQTREILGSITPTAELLSPSWHTNSNVPVPAPTQIESISHSNTLGGTIPRLQKDKRNLKKVAQRAKAKVQALQAEIKAIKATTMRDMKRLDLCLNLEREMSIILESKLTKLRKSSMRQQRKSYALQQQNGRLQSRLKNSLNPIKCHRKLALKYGSIYSFKARSLVCHLCCLNIPDVTIGKVIKECSVFFGITLNSVPSARTCSRIMIEAGIAAGAQIVEVAQKAKGKLSNFHLPLTSVARF